MKIMILALSTLLSTTAFATSDSFVKIYYPYVGQELGYCIGTHMAQDGISTNSDSGIHTVVAGVKAPVRVTVYGSKDIKSQQNINFIYAGPDVELYTLKSITEKQEAFYTRRDIVIDFAWMKKYNDEMYGKFAPLSYYSLIKSLTPTVSISDLVTIKIINSPITKIGDVVLDAEQALNPYLVDRVKLELQKSGLLALDAACR